MPSSRRPPRPGAPARPGSGPRGTSGTKPTKRSTSSGSASPRAASPAPRGRRQAPRPSPRPAGRPPGPRRRPARAARRAAEQTDVDAPRRRPRAGGPASEPLRLPPARGGDRPDPGSVRRRAPRRGAPAAHAARVRQPDGELRDLRAGLEQAQAEHTELEAELARWDDQAYVEREARDRLNFVMPGSGRGACSTRRRWSTTPTRRPDGRSRTAPSRVRGGHALVRGHLGVGAGRGRAAPGRR